MTQLGCKMVRERAGGEGSCDIISIIGVIRGNSHRDDVLAHDMYTHIVPFDKPLKMNRAAAIIVRGKVIDCYNPAIDALPGKRLGYGLSLHCKSDQIRAARAREAWGYTEVVMREAHLVKRFTCVVDHVARSINHLARNELEPTA